MGGHQRGPSDPSGEVAESLEDLIQGRADAQDVIRLTEAFRKITGGLLGGSSLDIEFKQHLDFVFNQVIQQVRKNGVTKESGEYIGKMLFRLYNVYQVYKMKSSGKAPGEMVAEAANILKMMADKLGWVL